MGENLVIVESPAKAKTIEKFLGKGFTVASSFGHIRDLSKKNLGIDIDNGFEPCYEVSADKKIKERVFETLKICGLYPFRNWPVSALSFGQKTTERNAFCHNSSLM